LLCNQLPADSAIKPAEHSPTVLDFKRSQAFQKMSFYTSLLSVSLETGIGTHQRRSWNLC